MSKVNIAGIIAGAEKVLAGAREMLPVAKVFGGETVAHAATLAIATGAVIKNVLERAADAKVALTEQDEAKLRAMLTELQNVNDDLAGNIAKS